MGRSRETWLRKCEVNVSSRIAPGEWRFVAWVAVVLLVVTSMPYLFGHLVHPDDVVFMGIAYGVSDTALYFSWLRGFQEHFFIDNHATPEPNAAVFMNVQWWGLAQLMRFLGLTHLQVFHIFRVLSVIGFAIAVYWFISMYMADPAQRRIAFLIAQFGGGLGWVWVVVKYAMHAPDVAFPFDLYTVEPNSFLSQMSFPHFTAAAALIVAVLGTMMKGVEHGQWRLTWVACVLGLILGFSHAYDLLLIYVIVGLYVVFVWLRDGFSWRPLWQLLSLVVVTCALAFYSAYITSDRYPVWRAVLAQFDLAGAWTPDPFHLLFLLGVPFILTLLGLEGLVPLRKHSLVQIFVRVWFLGNLFLVYVPVNFQIHYLNGWQVPIAILATEVLCGRVVPSVKSWSVRGAPTLAKWLPLLLIVIVLPTNAYLFAWRFIDLGRYEHPYFIHRDEDAALDWLADRVNSNDVVFCTQALGQYVPIRTGARAFLGHWAMTKDLYEKRAMVASFFSQDGTDEDRRFVLSSFAVDYVIWGQQERELGSFDPSQAAYLSPCFVGGQASVYCVVQPVVKNAESH